MEFCKEEKSGEKKLPKNALKILEILKNNKYASTAEIVKTLKIGTTTVEDNIKKLKDRELLKRVGPDNGGHWEVKE